MSQKPSRSEGSSETDYLQKKLSQRKNSEKQLRSLISCSFSTRDATSCLLSSINYSKLTVFLIMFRIKQGKDHWSLMEGWPGSVNSWNTIQSVIAFLSDGICTPVKLIRAVKLILETYLACILFKESNREHLLVRLPAVAPRTKQKSEYICVKTVDISTSGYNVREEEIHSKG